jgi:hypothetical protein
MGGFSLYTQTEEETSRWRPFLIAAVVILLLGALVWFLGRGSDKAPAQSPPPAYASALQISDLHLSTAQNFVGGEVTYIQGTIANNGSQTVTDAMVEVVFRNSLGQIVDRQAQPLRVAASPLGHPDWLPLRSAPLTPNKTASFRLTFEHISADWNRGLPELRFLQLVTK